MEWISVKDRLPIEYSTCTKHESVEVLIVSGGQTEYTEFTCGHLPEPWYKFGSFHKGFITHWMPLPEPPITQKQTEK